MKGSVTHLASRLPELSQKTCLTQVFLLLPKPHNTHSQYLYLNEIQPFYYTPALVSGEKKKEKKRGKKKEKYKYLKDKGVQLSGLKKQYFILHI